MTRALVVLLLAAGCIPRRAAVEAIVDGEPVCARLHAPGCTDLRACVIAVPEAVGWLETRSRPGVLTPDRWPVDGCPLGDDVCLWGAREDAFAAACDP